MQQLNILFLQLTSELFENKINHNILSWEKQSSRQNQFLELRETVFNVFGPLFNSTIH